MPLSTSLAPSPIATTRLARGLTQHELAARAGICRDTVSRLERGDLPTIRTALAVAAALGASITEILPCNGESPVVTPGSREDGDGTADHVPV